MISINIIKTIFLYILPLILLPLIGWYSMAIVTVSVPDRLKEEMGKVDWVNWSSIARRAFIDTLKDVKELEIRKKVRKISEIDDNDTREVKDEIVKDVIRSTTRTIKDLKSGKQKAMTLEEFNKWCDSL